MIRSNVNSGTRAKVLGIIGLSMFLCGGITWAQGTTGTISGTVKDNTGAVIPAVEVVILNEGTGISRTVLTDKEGHYLALSLSLGNYRVKGSHEGFQGQARSGIELTVGREAVVDLVLAPGGTTQTVEVTGEASLVESTTGSLSSLVDERSIRELPLNGRSYDQLALLQPGVILTDPGPTGGAIFVGGSSSRFSVGGQRPASNLFLLDGTDINDQANGNPGGSAGTNLGVDTILEFKIFTSSFKAEYGHSMGSVISAVTRSGTNRLHGTIFEYIRNSAFDARNYFDVGSTPPTFRRNQFGGVLGGPIKKDRTFFFGGYEGLRQAQGTTQFATVPTALARQGILPNASGGTTKVTVNPIMVPYLNLYPLPNGRDFGDGTGQYLSAPTVPTNEDNIMVRVDHQVNHKTNMFARYTFDKDNLNAQQNLPNNFIVEESRRQYSTLQATSVLTPTILNNFRFAFNRTYQLANLEVLPDPGLSFVPGQGFGTIQVGGVNGSGTRAITQLGTIGGNDLNKWTFNVFQLGDDFTYITGKHSLKAGVDIVREQDNTVYGAYVRGTYTFSTITTLLAGTPSNLQVLSPVGSLPYYALRQNTLGVYGQDDWAVTPRLTLNLGLRWEATSDPREAKGKNEILPSPSATATVLSDHLFSIGNLNFEPRVGLAWQLNASGKTVLRAGAGIYHNQVWPAIYTNPACLPPVCGRVSKSNPTFPNGYQSLPGGPPSATGNGLIALSVMAPNLKTPANYEYNLSFQQQFFKSAVFQVAYAGNQANHLLVSREADTPTPTFVNGKPFYASGAPRMNTAWAGIRQFTTDGTSSYHSGAVTLRRQASSGFVGQIFYTFSKAMDQASNANGADGVRSAGALLNPFDRSADIGLADFNVKHRVGANFSYPVPIRVFSKALGMVINGWTLNGIATLASGQPFTPRLSSSVSRDLSTSFAERPNLNPGFSNNPTHGVSGGCSGFAAGTAVGNVTNWYDPCAFSLPAAGTYGNLGRNTLIGPALMDLDGTLEKSFKLGEKAVAQFRFEMFNILNHSNFGLPNTVALASSGAANGSAGNITYTTTSSRQIQFATRISY